MPRIKIVPVVLALVIFYAPVYLVLRYLSIDAAQFVVLVSGFAAGFACADVSNVAPFWQTTYAIVLGKALKEEIIMLMLMDPRVVRTTFKSFASLLRYGNTVQEVLLAQGVYLVCVMGSIYLGAFLADRNNKAHELRIEKTLNELQQKEAEPKIKRASPISFNDPPSK